MDIGTLTGAIELEDQISRPLDIAADHIREFATEFDGLTKTVLVGSAAITAAIGGAIVSIIALGEKGSTILGVEEAFDKFAKTVGSTGEEMFSALDAGLRSTVDSMEQMQATTKLLSSGVKITADDMNLLGKSAREMAKATGEDAATSLNTLSMAMQTGNTRALKRIGINIDMAKAERDFATSIGTVRSELSQAGIVQARTNAILEALQQRLNKSGESALSFKERVQQANVAIGNWFDNLAKGVAKSSAVNDAFDAISKSFVETFGGTAQSLQQNILKWIDDFAVGVGKWGPIVIRAFGTVKDWIVNVWNELVSFNDRYQITNNLIAGAKFAWNVLEQAFMLVQKAVRAVIQAWAEMPEWLQRITQGALRASLAVGAFSVGVGAVAAPVAALVSKVDLATNIFGNLSGAIFSTLSIFDRMRGVTAASTAAIIAETAATEAATAAKAAEMGVTIASLEATTALTIGTRIQQAASVALAFTYNSVTIALVFWQDAVTLMVARIGELTIVTRASAIVNAVVAASYTAMATAIAYVNDTALVMGARMIFASTATRVAGVSTTVTGAAMTIFNAAMIYINSTALVMGARMTLVSIATRLAGVEVTATAIAMGLLGTAMLAIPVVALAFGIYKVIDAVNEWRKSTDNKNFWGYLHDTRDYDNWARKALEYLGILEMLDKINPVAPGTQEPLSKKIHKGGTFKIDDFVAPTISPGVTAKGSSEMEAARAEREKSEKAAQGIGLVNDGFLKGSTFAEDYAKKVHDLTKSFVEMTFGTNAFTDAFKNLTPAQRSNFELQQALVPEIDKLIQAHKKLAPGMLEVRTASMAAEQAFLAQDKAVLEASGLTLGQIELMKKLGLSETEIAGNYGVTTKALQQRIAAMQEAAQIEQNLQTFSAALLKQQEGAAARREVAEKKANAAIGQSYEDLEDLIAKSTMTSTELQIRQIKKEQLAREVAFDASVSGLKDAEQQTRAYHAVQEQLSAKAVHALMVDNTALVENSKAAHDEIVAKAQMTYMAAAAAADQYSDDAIKAFKRAAEEAKRGFVSIADSIRDALKQIPDLLIDAFTGGGGLLGALKALAVSLGATFAKTLSASIKKGVEDGISGLSNQGKLAAGGLGAIAGIAAAANGASAAKALGQVGLAAAGVTASAALAAGSLTGAAVAAGALTLGVGAAAVGAFLLVKHFVGVSKAVKETRTAVAEFEDKLHGTLTEAQKLEAGGVAWKETVIAVRDAYILVGKSAADADNITKQLWDTGHPARARAAADIIAVNVALAKQVSGVRDLVQAHLGAGRTIPAALQASIDKLVIMGKLTTDNAEAMLDLASTSVPSYADVTAAAERYGIVVATLGNAVQGIKVTEVANQMVTDWKTMEDAGADMLVVMMGMKDEVLDLITDAQKFGTALPAAMKPIITRMDEAGQFTDEFGNKLVDVSQLTFAETLEDKIQRIVDAMLILADVIKDKVGGALDEIGNKTVSPKIAPTYQKGGIQEPQGPEVTNPGEPTYHATGGKVLPFEPRVVEPSYHATGGEVVQPEVVQPQVIEPAYHATGGEVVQPEVVQPQVIEPAYHATGGEVVQPEVVQPQVIEPAYHATGGEVVQPEVVQPQVIEPAYHATGGEVVQPEVVQPQVIEPAYHATGGEVVQPEVVQPQVIEPAYHATGGEVVQPEVVQPQVIEPAYHATGGEVVQPEVVQPQVIEPAYHATGGEVVQPEVVQPQVIEPAYHETGGKVLAFQPRVQESSPEAIETVEPVYHATGGKVGEVVDFKPKGTDTVPAMLTPGETVLTVAETNRMEQGVSSTMTAISKMTRAVSTFASKMTDVTELTVEVLDDFTKTPLPARPVVPTAPTVPTPPRMPQPSRPVAVTTPAAPRLPQPSKPAASAWESFTMGIHKGFMNMLTKQWVPADHPIAVQEGLVSSKTVEMSAQMPQKPSYFGSGGEVDFQPRGRDTVPAVLTPGERVLTPEQNKDYEGGGGTAIVELDGMVLTKVIVPRMRKEVKRYRQARR